MTDVLGDLLRFVAAFGGVAQHASADEAVTAATFGKQAY
jgi:hypothetical protein